MFKIKSISLKNFLGYEGEKEFRFNKNIILLQGPSGCGKTTILEALSLLFFGTSIVRGKTENQLNINIYQSLKEGNLKEAEQYVKGVIDKNGEEYILLYKRIYKAGKKKIFTSNYFEISDGKGNIIFKDSKINRYRDRVYSLLGFDKDTFKIFDPQKYIVLRHSILSLKVDWIDNLFDFASFKKKVNSKIRELELQESNYLGQIEVLEGIIEDYEKKVELLKNEKEISIDYQKIREDITALKGTIFKLEQEKQKLENYKIKAEKEINKRNKERELYVGKVSSLQSEMRKTVSLLNKNKCPTCERPFTESDKKNYSKLISALRIEIEKNKKLLQKYTDYITDVKNKKKKAELKINEINNLIMKNKLKLNNLNSELNTKTNSKAEIFKKYLEEIKNNKEKINKYKNEIKKINDNKNFYTKIKQLIPQIQNKFEEIMLENILVDMRVFLEVLFDDFSDIVWDPELKEFSLKLKNDFIPYSLLSTGQKFRVIFSYILSIVGKSFPLLVDELIDVLDENNYFKLISLLENNDFQLIMTTTKFGLEERVNQEKVQIIKINT